MKAIIILSKIHLTAILRYRIFQKIRLSVYMNTSKTIKYPREVLKPLNVLQMLHGGVISRLSHLTRSYESSSNITLLYPCCIHQVMPIIST